MQHHVLPCILLIGLGRYDPEPDEGDHREVHAVALFRRGFCHPIDAMCGRLTSMIHREDVGFDLSPERHVAVSIDSSLDRHADVSIESSPFQAVMERDRNLQMH